MIRHFCDQKSRTKGEYTKKFRIETASGTEFFGIIFKSSAQKNGGMTDFSQLFWLALSRTPLCWAFLQPCLAALSALWIMKPAMKTTTQPAMQTASGNVAFY
ncbi:MAG: hypothetical protein IJK56_03510 [Firmicutes bacterium]|nr:hypothetical protein [Bacillota bacterium]